LLVGIKELLDFRFIAHDGEIGKITDILFNDYSWHVQYLVLVASIGDDVRKILVPFSSLCGLDTNARTVVYFNPRRSLSKCKVLELDPPVSLQNKLKRTKSRVVSQFPNPGFMWGYPPLFMGFVDEGNVGEDTGSRAGSSIFNPHLRSAIEVIGYKIESETGKAGKIIDFLIDSLRASMRYCIIRKGLWRKVAKISIPVKCISEINYYKSSVKVSTDLNLISDI
jgi:hypothetical protein